MTSPLRPQVLALYRRLIRLGHNWEARNPQDTPVERAYILEETRRLFRENAGAASEDRVADHIREAEARVTMAEHYRNPYPRPVNLPQRSFAIRQKKEGQRGVGKAVKKFQDMSKPIYLKSIDDTKKEDK